MSEGQILRREAADVAKEFILVAVGGKNWVFESLSGAEQRSCKSGGRGRTTAGGCPEDFQKCIHLGVVGFLVKGEAEVATLEVVEVIAGGEGASGGLL